MEGVCSDEMEEVSVVVRWRECVCLGVVEGVCV